MALVYCDYQSNVIWVSLRTLTTKYNRNDLGNSNLTFLFQRSFRRGTRKSVVREGQSRPQSPRSFWSAPGIETSGRDRSRKSANHGLPAFVRSLRNLNNNGYYRLQKWAAIALARYLVPARGLDPWRRPKGSWALGTRMREGTRAHIKPHVTSSHRTPRLTN